MQLTLRVEFVDGREPITVKPTLFCTVLAERKYKNGIQKVLETNMQEVCGYLAYEASKLSGITVPALFDDYLKSLQSCLPIEVNDPKVDAVHTATD